MAAPLPQLSDFPFSTELTTRFDDMDILGHINNVAIANLYQESRVMFHRELFRWTRGAEHRKDGVGTVLVDVHIAYRRETFYPKPVTVTCGVSRLGNTSYTIHSGMYQDGECVGSCDAVLVYVKEGKPQPIPKEEREILAKYQMRSQESREDS
jgi:acyl-CoA thioester hydrolase